MEGLPARGRRRRDGRGAGRVSGFEAVAREFVHARDGDGRRACEGAARRLGPARALPRVGARRADARGRAQGEKLRRDARRRVHDGAGAVVS